MEKSASSSGRPTGSMNLTSELQTEREVNVDKGCRVVITSLGGQTIIEHVIEETFPFVLFTQVLLRTLISLAAQRLRVPVEVLEESDTCKIHWQRLSSANLCGIFCIGTLSTLSDEAYDKVDTKMNNFHRMTNHHLSETCEVCFGPSEYARTVISQLGNCVRCEPCFLCPLCKVYIKEQPVCYVCIDLENDDTLVLPDRVRHRIYFLVGAD